MGVFSDEGKVEQGIGEVLVGESGVGKHTGARMAFSDGAASFLVIFEAQHVGITQIGSRRVQFRDELGRVAFQSWGAIQIAIDAMAVVANTLAVEDVSPPQDIAL